MKTLILLITLIISFNSFGLAIIGEKKMESIFHGICGDPEDPGYQNCSMPLSIFLFPTSMIIDVQDEMDVKEELALVKKRMDIFLNAPMHSKREIDSFPRLMDYCSTKQIESDEDLYNCVSEQIVIVDKALKELSK